MHSFASLVTTTALLGVLCVLSFAHVLPSPPLLQERQTDEECSQAGEVYRASCWDKYDLSNYLLKWNQSMMATVCGTVADPLDCNTERTCLADEPWSTCFLRIAELKAGESCLSLDGQGCDKNSPLDPNLDPSIVGQVRYIVRSIYMVESFFGSYFSALGDAITNTNLMIGSIIRTIDPKQNTAVNPINILTALTVGLSFLTAPALGAAAISSISHAGLQKAASVWAVSLASSPGVVKSIWPQGSESSITWQINQVQTQVKTITDDYRNMLNNGLKAVMLDPGLFTSFADHGVFAASNPLDAADTLNYTGLALQTYIVSEALGQNKWYITPGKTSTEDEFNQDLPFAPPCNQGPLGRCLQPKSTRDEWYWSPTTTRRYHFQVVHDDETVPLTSADMMSTIVNNGWTDLDVLFNGAYDCALNGDYASGNVFRLDPVTNAIDTTCISHLPVKSKCGEGCAVEVPPGQQCPFDDDCQGCPASPHGGISCGISLTSGPQIGNSTISEPVSTTADTAAAPATATPPTPKLCQAATLHGGSAVCQAGTGPGSVA